MKPIRHFLIPVAALAALTLPAAVLAQTSPGTATAPAPAGTRHHGGFMRELSKLNLTADQQARISALRAQFQQAHPKGSPRDPAAMKAYREQLQAILTPSQVAQFKADMHAGRGEPGEARGGMMQRFAALNLSDGQKSQIQALVTQFKQAHPAGSPPDPQSRQALHKQINAILTPQQIQQLHQKRPDNDNGTQQ